MDFISRLRDLPVIRTPRLILRRVSLEGADPMVIRSEERSE